jgi:hypothetical protein
MTTWIVTTGNSDIQLKTNVNWESLYEEVRYNSPIADCDQFLSLERDKKSNLFPAPARVLGLVYRNQLDKDEDLAFPLLDTFLKEFKKETLSYPTKIIVLLTDQEKIFSEDKRIDERCPYWQDTCTLEVLFKRYFEKEFEVSPLFLYLQPEPDKGKGLDHWNETLSLVENTLNDARLDDDPNSSEPVYVSHQAGTPAISSAVQFVSLGKFSNVKFLVSNQYYDDAYDQQSEAEAIESSSYWRGLQIQKAKQLIIDGFPGAALNLLKEIKDVKKEAVADLEKLVDRFNIKSSAAKGQEFQRKPATQRIVESVDLIEKFFEHENYIQGITILSAAQETFLKVAVLSQIDRINETINGVKVSKLVKWDHSGLYLRHDSELKRELKLNDSDDLVKTKLDILQKLKFPVSDSEFWDKLHNQKDFSIINRNTGLFKWLHELRKDFRPWALLEWSCQYRREREDDLRNKLMHNLLGVEKSEVIEYLLGYKQDLIRAFSGKAESDCNSVTKAYIEQVKNKLTNALKLFGLLQEDQSENELNTTLQKLADFIE